jgi:hypothetical protein
LLEIAQRGVNADNSSIPAAAAAAAAAASRCYACCNWLPALASCLSKQLQGLELQLQAPLPAVQQPLLLQMQELRTLSCVQAEQLVMRQQLPAAHLFPEVVVQLSVLQQLRSLTVTMGPAVGKTHDIQVTCKIVC